MCSSPHVHVCTVCEKLKKHTHAQPMQPNTELWVDINSPTSTGFLDQCSTIQLCTVCLYASIMEVVLPNMACMLTLSPYSPLVAGLGLVRHTSQPGWGTGPRDLFSAIPSGASELAV